MTPDIWISGYIGDPPNTAAEIDQSLRPDKTLIAVNSFGGVASDGAAIKAVLEARGSASVLVVGIAASAASLMIMGASRIVIHQDALLMIHDPAAMTIGPASTHRKAADDLEKMSDLYADSYARATGHPKARIAQWMNAETWMTAEEAVHLNFADEVWAGEAQAVARFDYSKFRNAPQSLVRMALENGWTSTEAAE